MAILKIALVAANFGQASIPSFAHGLLILINASLGIKDLHILAIFRPLEAL